MTQFFGEEAEMKLDIKHSRSKDKSATALDEVLPALVRMTLNT